LLDNGRDYKARDVFNTECEEVINSLAVNLQLDTVYAIPYNAKAKPIERTFDTFEQQFGKLHPTYAGSNAKVRPESLQILDIMNYPTLDEFIAMHDQYVYEVYNNASHDGSYMYGKSPNSNVLFTSFSVRVWKKVCISA
jgi:putative transposase